MAYPAVADSATSASARELAERHGLHVAGARPSVPGYVGQLWRYRHFISAYANAKVTTSLSQTKLGRIWQVLTPVTNAAVYYLIFGVILNTSRGQNNFIAYLCVGVFLFSFTQGAVQNGIKSITDNLTLIRALHFPRASLPIATALIELQHMIAAMAVLIGIVLLSGEPVTVEWFTAVPALLLMAVFNTGLALYVARLGAKVLDLKQIVPFVLRAWMYFSAVLYPVQRFEEHAHGWKLAVIKANPLLVYIELMRSALMEDVQLAGSHLKLWVLAVAWAVVAFSAGFVYFWKGERDYGRG
jgi:teichoic acid transport system permease protein